MVILQVIRTLHAVLILMINYFLNKFYSRVTFVSVTFIFTRPDHHFFQLLLVRLKLYVYSINLTRLNAPGNGFVTDRGKNSPIEKSRCCKVKFTCTVRSCSSRTRPNAYADIRKRLAGSCIGNTTTYFSRLTKSTYWRN